MKFLFRLVFIFSLFFTGGVAYACPNPELTAEQTLDVVTLNQAQVYPANLGSQTDANTCKNLADLGVTGYVDSAPTLALQLSADQAGGLIFGGRSTCDTVMIVQQPDQTLLFSDDGGSARQPLITTSGGAGAYLVWLGQYDPQESCSAEIVVSPGRQICPNGASLSQATVGLTTNALVEGLTLATRAGGTLDMAGCASLVDADILAAGFTSFTPQFDFMVADTTDGAVMLEVPGICDTSLLALDSKGTWYFNDDNTDSFTPQLNLPLGDMASFKVWVGTYGVETCDVELVVSDQKGSLADAHACPTIGVQAETNLILVSGAQYDPLSLTLGGTQQLENCTGDVAAAFGTGFFSGIPHVNLLIEEGSPDFFKVTANASCDSVMLAVGPDGSWYFSDDADGMNPILNFPNPQTGIYSIWLGSYEGESNCAGTLGINSESLACPSPTLPGKETYGYALTDLAGGKSHDVIAGGYTDVSACDGIIAASGFFMDRPDFAFDLSLNAGEQVQVIGKATCDTVLLVHGSGGTWQFDDDSGVDEFDSQITITSGSGTYQVWLGTYGPALCEGGVTLKRGLFKE